MIESLDTNVLVYASDTSQGLKHETAKALLDRAFIEGWPIATQVLGEFYNVATRKNYMTRDVAAKAINSWLELLTPITTTSTAFQKAIAYASRTGTQFWDAMILATCAEHGVAKLHTEDIGAQKQAMGVRLVNPF
jgi:predicted nucleic acid-binding protein